MSWLAEIKDGLSLVLLSFPSYFAFVLNCINLTKLSSPKFVQSGKDNFSQGVRLFFGAHGLQVFCDPRQSQQVVYSVERNSAYSKCSIPVVASATPPKGLKQIWINTIAQRLWAYELGFPYQIESF